MNNTLKTVFLMTLMMVLLLAIGSALGGRSGLVIAFVFSLLMNFFAYWFSDKIVLAMYRAKEVTEAEAPKLYSMVKRLATRAGLPMPKLYIIPSMTPNAFATGRNPQNAAVAVTEGIMKLLNDDELEGVLGHELAHVKHRDILTATIVATMVGAITFLARMAQWSLIFFGGSRDRENNANWIAELVLIIVAPIAAVLIQLAISRAREFAADEGGAKISGKPLALANALRKLERGVETIPMEARPETAHMFIVNPLRGEGILKLFSTHPPISERVKRLEKLAREMGVYY
ncbi:Heat shock protein. Metallo peptidase. MEROPS family M48B [Candidatus Kryptonium thompsonii]|uniref:Protease HtpX homolog n=3 Tax=Candidatus Kryptonium thompsonii TaxID=1633631 RepID=A0A0N7MUT1_9BACT|nr:zinc metalloprotease HtpX [Candidatus Kryptonium thompsoni]CUS76944.1 Heat shock protein. Metallo peptidase. MEROPS family M48B [Candidatus Kryptonium thompsoni]CUS80206.1 Heat shock protein. Metallo peptidase. MEROPS family M48B [Candidatus Kryptonium thompsoni]CUS81779.1 Heat shock protein. Metallo peptidase. MEROPS family M48B [Candidatus Kryptonium thompsoni]CUS86193.1 Heat shock protein. Metallo peptidase. MEROPS family M48B [Candidatus Kryptonium thompsoni]CUS93907.1 Heat shock protei